MNRAKMSEAELDAIRDRIQLGWTKRAIAADLGRSESAVSRAVAGLTHQSKPALERRVPDLSWMDKGRCVKVRGWDDEPVSVRKETCLVGGGCPVLDQCRRHGETVMAAGWVGGKADEGLVFGGLVGQELKLLLLPVLVMS